ncbi:MAG TPA: endonuclease V [Acidimicrobiales bacterium]|nr:endonuclease V [Acidimicrobiales bacterium]
MPEVSVGWPVTGDELIRVQGVLAHEAAAVLKAAPWSLHGDPSIGGCFVAFARGEAGPGQAGDRAWAAAVTWRPAASPFGRGGAPHRHPDDALRGAVAEGGPRRSSDVDDQAVVADRVPAGYAPGLLALREGPILAAAVGALDAVPDVVLVDATGLDHPRRAGLAVHLGAVTGLPTVGVTHGSLLAAGDLPSVVRGASSPALLEGSTVGYWLCTRTGARPVLVHAGWRTDPETALAVVLLASTEAARTPVPLQEARRVAREARAVAGGG